MPLSRPLLTSGIGLLILLACPTGLLSITHVGLGARQASAAAPAMGDRNDTVFAEFGVPLGRCGFAVVRQDLALKDQAQKDVAQGDQAQCFAQAARQSYVRQALRSAFGATESNVEPITEITEGEVVAAPTTVEVAADQILLETLAQLFGLLPWQPWSAIPGADLTFDYGPAPAAPCDDAASALVVEPLEDSWEQLLCAPLIAERFLPAIEPQCRLEFLRWSQASVWLGIDSWRLNDCRKEAARAKNQARVENLSDLMADFSHHDAGEAEVLRINRQQDGLSPRPHTHDNLASEPAQGVAADRQDVVRDYDWSLFFQSLPEGPQAASSAGSGSAIADSSSPASSSAAHLLAKIGDVQSTGESSGFELILDGPLRWLYLRHESSTPRYPSALAAANSIVRASKLAVAATAPASDDYSDDAAWYDAQTMDFWASEEPASWTPEQAGLWSVCEPSPPIAANAADQFEHAARVADQFNQLVKLAGASLAWLEPALNVVKALDQEVTEIADESAQELMNVLLNPRGGMACERSSEAGAEEASHSDGGSGDAEPEPWSVIDVPRDHAAPTLESYLGL